MNQKDKIVYCECVVILAIKSNHVLICKHCEKPIDLTKLK